MSEVRQKILTASGRSIVMLYDSRWQGKILPVYFDPDHWQASPDTEILAKGRGTTYKVQCEFDRHAWVLRQYRRGGLFGRVIKQSYFFSGESRVRSFAEWRLLQSLREQDLPVPEPVAAMYFRLGPYYRAAILTRYIPETRTLSQLLSKQGNIPWSGIATAIHQLHRAGLIHGDLNAHNILIDKNDSVTVIDLDKSGYLPGIDLSSQHRANLERLQRSVNKVSTRPEQTQQKDWDEFISAYRNS
ncbi:MAG: 3-deoxy-D-manno-octulosonic acid kinase [Gammaproteobacteria bacterium]|nr:3-deoxy-D-manno-octulosonic acid kinase [Gammaproteobacteria bacterium]NNC97529.1 3-deoxy-D-manno-octulosonic acid kinase [Gammaproteobacteria bacterium]NNM14245.1 3-deoxy-D-manno-octulosonic acid kinase [Gammaproteobacteria bacterium]